MRCRQTRLHDSTGLLDLIMCDGFVQVLRDFPLVVLLFTNYVFHRIRATTWSIDLSVYSSPRPEFCEARIVEISVRTSVSPPMHPAMPTTCWRPLRGAIPWCAWLETLHGWSWPRLTSIPLRHAILLGKA